MRLGLLTDGADRPTPNNKPPIAGGNNIRHEPHASMGRLVGEGRENRQGFPGFGSRSLSPACAILFARRTNGRAAAAMPFAVAQSLAGVSSIAWAAVLILAKAFTSMPDEAQKVCPLMPARWLVRTQVR